MLWSLTIASQSENGSACHELRARYGMAIRRAFLGAVAAHVLLFLFAPRVTVRPYRLAVSPDPPELVDVEEISYPVPPAAPLVAPVDPEPYPQPPTKEPVETPPPGPPEASPPGAFPGTGPSVKDDAFFAYEASPQLVHFEAPRYPALAREAGIEGTVRVRVWVDEVGRVSDAIVISSEATPSMDEAALEAARRCRFEPAKQRNVAVRTMVEIPFVFKLD